MRASLLLSLCAIVCAAIAAGCGASSTLSKQELASKADAICRDNRRAVAEQLGSLPTTPAAIAAYDGGDLRLDPAFEDRLKALKPPKSEKAAYKSYLASRTASLSLTRREEAVARSGNQRALQAFTAQRQAGSQLRARLAQQLGFKVCGVAADVPNLLGPPQPLGPPPASVHYPKPKDTLDDAIAGAALHQFVSENSSYYARGSPTVAFPGPTDSGPRLIRDVRADKAAKPQVLGIDILYGFFELKANGDNYVLITTHGPTGYKFIGFYPLAAG